MKKAQSEHSRSRDDGMLPEYDFSNAVRGKFYKPLEKGYSILIRKANGTNVVKHMYIRKGAVMLAPDVRKFFPTSNAVNRALRSLIPANKRHDIRARSR